MVSVRRFGSGRNLGFWFGVIALMLGGCGNQVCTLAGCPNEATFFLEYPQGAEPVALEVCQGATCSMVEIDSARFDSGDRFSMFASANEGELRATVSRNGTVWGEDGEVLRLTLFSATDEIASKQWAVNVETVHPNGEGCGQCVVPTLDEYR